jgi:uncharacterized repeat protein (TIGR02059 family)
MRKLVIGTLSIVALMLPVAAAANTVPHWSSGVPTLNIGNNGSLSATHPTYSGSYTSWKVFDYYKCDTQPTFATDASRQFSTLSTGNGSGDWSLVVGGVNSLNADVSIGGASGCRHLGTQFTGPVRAEHDSKYILAASRTSLSSGGPSTYYYVFSDAVQYNHAFASVLSASVPSHGSSVVLNTSNAQSGNSGQPGEFVVTVNGSQVTVTSISRSNSQIQLALESSVRRGDSVTVAKVSNIWSAYNLAVFSAMSVTNESTVGGASIQGAGASAAPIKYSGPEFSELSLKPALAGSSATLEGRKLDQISSVTIGGKAAVLSNATDKSVNIGLPAGLAPGVYDLVVNTANHGKLTHMNAIRVREVLPATSLTIKGSGVLTGEEFKKLTAFSRTQNPDMDTVTCIVNSNSEGKSFMQARALCDRISATNLNIKNTKFEARSTVEGSASFARVVFSSEQ